MMTLYTSNSPYAHSTFYQCILLNSQLFINQKFIMCESQVTQMTTCNADAYTTLISNTGVSTITDAVRSIHAQSLFSVIILLL